MISKGIFGIGCSYMWGEGYTIIVNYLTYLPNIKPYFDEENIRSTHCSFKNKHRFIQLVSDHYIWNWTFGNGYNMNGGSKCTVI